MRETIANKYRALEADLRNKVDSGKTESLSLSDIQAVCMLAKNLLVFHSVKTFIKNVAEYFKQFGFLVTQEFDGVSFVIAE